MKRYFKVEMAVDGWGLLVNEGTVEEPKFRVVLKGSELQMEELAADMNREATSPLTPLPQGRRGGPERGSAGQRRHD